jgi:fructosamine-3-kinase
MTTDIHDALETYTTDYEIGRQLHDVPPHSVVTVTVDGTRAVCKLASTDDATPAVEARAMQFVDRRTTVPVPSVLAMGSDWFLAAWHDDVTHETVLDARSARALGTTLATLHDETAPAFDASGRIDTTGEE